MRVKIDHGEHTTGFIRKTKFHTVTLDIEFNEEELTLIKQRNLGNTLIMERPPSAELPVYENDPPNRFWLIIDDVVRGKDTYMVETISEAKEYAAEIEAKLPDLKAYIMNNAEIDEGEQSKTLEF